MREFWVASGHHLTRLDRDGRMVVTDELILAWLARPEILPPDDACPAEDALHARLMAAPRAKVRSDELDELADPDARENWRYLVTMRDALILAGTVEDGYLDLVRRGVKLPFVLLDQLVQLILRNALHGCEDPLVLRAAELFFRPQRGYLRDGALMLADDELARELEAERHSSPLAAMLRGGAEALDVMGDGNGWTYWSRSDAHTMVLPFGADPNAREALASVIAAFVRHLLGHEVQVVPVPRAEGVEMRWFIGLDEVGTTIGNALWRGKSTEDALVGLFRLRFLQSDGVRPDMANAPVWLLLGMRGDNAIRLKPQNIVMGLPLVEEGRARGKRPVPVGRA